MKRSSLTWRAMLPCGLAQTVMADPGLGGIAGLWWLLYLFSTIFPLCFLVVLFVTPRNATGVRMLAWFVVAAYLLAGFFLLPREATLGPFSGGNFDLLSIAYLSVLFGGIVSLASETRTRLINLAVCLTVLTVQALVTPSATITYPWDPLDDQNVDTLVALDPKHVTWGDRWFQTSGNRVRIKSPEPAVLQEEPRPALLVKRATNGSSANDPQDPGWGWHNPFTPSHRLVSVAEEISELPKEWRATDEQLAYAVRVGRRLDWIEELLARGADPDALTKEGLSVVHFAIARSSYAVAEILLAHGADINLPDANGDSIAHHLARHEGIETTKMRFLLRYYANFSLPNARGKTPVGIMDEILQDPAVSDPVKRYVRERRSMLTANR